MTIALSLKVNDGVVLATDSASTVFVGDQRGNPIGIAHVFNHANKVFNLRKGLPVGAITWGAGSIGNSSISTLVKDFRERISSQGDETYRVNLNDYTIKEVAEKLKRFIFDEHYSLREVAQRTPLGFIVAGYSSGAEMADEFKIETVGGETAPTVVQVRLMEQCGVAWNGLPEAINRLLLGYSPALPQLAAARGTPIEPAILQQLTASLVVPPMPIQDAIDLATFLVETTIKFQRFMPGAPMVGGSVEVAAITKHEKFRWVNRRFYFREDLNPKEES